MDHESMMGGGGNDVKVSDCESAATAESSRRERTAAASFYGWKSLAATAITNVVITGGVIYSFGVFLPSICKEFGWSRGVVSGASSMFVVVMSLSSPLAGIFISKHGPRKAIVFGNVLAVLGLLLLAYQTKVWQLYMGYGVLLGVGAGLGGVIATTTVANNWFRKKVSVAMSVLIMAGELGGILLIPLLMAMIKGVGWRTTYLFLAATAVVLSVLVPALFIRNTPEELGQVPDGESSSGEMGDGTAMKQGVTADFTLEEALRSRTFWLIMIAGALTDSVMSMLFAHQVAYLEGLGIASGTAAAAFGVLAGSGTLGNLAFGVLSLKFDLRHLALAACGLILAGICLVQVTQSVPMVFVYSVIYGVGNGAIMIAGMTLLSSYFGRREFPKIMGISMTVKVFGNLAAPIAGAIFDKTGSYRIAFLLGTMAVVIALICLIFVRPPEPSV